MLKAENCIWQEIVRVCFTYLFTNARNIKNAGINKQNNTIKEYNEENFGLGKISELFISIRR